MSLPVSNTSYKEVNDCTDLTSNLKQYISLDIDQRVQDMIFQVGGFDICLNNTSLDSNQSFTAIIKNSSDNNKIINNPFRGKISKTISNLFRNEKNKTCAIKHCYKCDSLEHFETVFCQYLDLLITGSPTRTFSINGIELNISFAMPAISPMVRKIPKTQCEYSISNTNPNGNIEKQNSIKEGILQVLKKHLPESKYTMEQVEA